MHANKYIIDWDYIIDDFVLVMGNNDIKFKLEFPTRETYKIVKVYSNGTMRIQNGVSTNCINICLCIPYLA